MHSPTGSWNGPFKLTVKNYEQIQEIKDIALAAEFSTGTGTVETIAVLPDYCRDIISRIDLGPRKLKVVVDAGNGMGGVTAVPVYSELGIEMVERTFVAVAHCGKDEIEAFGSLELFCPSRR